jgi:DNA ligase (NAD+)
MAYPEKQDKKERQLAIDRLHILRKTIEKHRYAYHVLDKLEISEEALDSLKKELVDIETRHPDLITPDSPSQRVAGEPMKAFKKVPHKVSQWSFNDAFSEDDIRNFDKRIKKILKEKYEKEINPSYVCELKIDGLKIVFEYEKGVLKTAATRGNGEVGEDVTMNVRTIQSVPIRLSKEENIIVEGEVWMSKENFENLNIEQKKHGLPLYANPRNVTAGTIRQLDPRIVSERNLDSFIYDIGQYEKVPKTQEEELRLLKDLGFKVNKHFTKVKDIEEVIKAWNEWAKKKEKLDYWMDGIVVKVNEKEYQEALGYTGKAPRFAVAFKFPAEQVTTVVENIVLQVGRTGVLTPVAHLRPVLVAGSVVSRATLHNEDEIKRLDVRVGDTVILQKAGDIIPDIVKVLTEMRTGREKPYKFPTHVPECGSDGRIERIPGQAAWRCVDKKSGVQIRRKFYHFVGKGGFDINHLGPKVMDLLMDNNLVTHYHDIFTLKKGDILALPRMGEKSADNLIESIEASKTVTLPRFLTSLSIPQVGEETAYDVAVHFKNLEMIKNASLGELEALQGVGPIVARSLYEFFKDKENLREVEKLLKHVKIISEKINLAGGQGNSQISGKIFVLTGTLSSLSRDEAKALIKKKGGKTSSSVSKNTDYVVTGENPGSKYDDAVTLGVKTLSEREFLAIMGQ